MTYLKYSASVPHACAAVRACRSKARGPPGGSGSLSTSFGTPLLASTYFRVDPPRPRRRGVPQQGARPAGGQRLVGPVVRHPLVGKHVLRGQTPPPQALALA